MKVFVDVLLIYDKHNKQSVEYEPSRINKCNIEQSVEINNVCNARRRNIITN